MRNSNFKLTFYSIIVNFAIMAIGIYNRWDVINMIVLYWIEALFVGIIGWVKILLAVSEVKKGYPRKVLTISIENIDERATKKEILKFFSLYYLIFWIICGAFIAGYFYYYKTKFPLSYALLFSFVGVVINQLYSFAGYLFGKEYLDHSSYEELKVPLIKLMSLFLAEVIFAVIISFLYQAGIKGSFSLIAIVFITCIRIFTELGLYYSQLDLGKKRSFRGDEND